MTQHKAAAIDFLHLASSGRAREAFERYGSAGFRHHNPSFSGDAESLAKAMDDNAAQYPAKSLWVRQAVEEADVVAVFSEVHHAPGDSGVAVVHMFRFEGDRLAELWDVAQPVPSARVNEHGMF
jgi:predicted SnoaL-like aldol condensation-catalyzing enzyme